MKKTVSTTKARASRRIAPPCSAPEGWIMQEAWWWTHPKYGGVVKESKRWGCYPLDRPDDSAAWRTGRLINAMRWLERRARNPNAGVQAPERSGGSLQ